LGGFGVLRLRPSIKPTAYAQDDDFGVELERTTAEATRIKRKSGQDAGRIHSILRRRLRARY
jgi:hypothetical protein